MSNPTNDLEYSRHLQEKFELYALALIFTVLALAIQTANFEKLTPIASILELASWFFLLVSGLVGMSRIEWMAVTYKNHGQLMKFKSQLRHLQDAADNGLTTIQFQETGKTMSLHMLITERTGVIDSGSERLDSLEKSILRKYAVHKWTFVTGIVLLACARSYSPAAGILKHLSQ